MFSSLLNFGLERNAKQAFGFYISYLFLISLVGGLLGGITYVITGSDNLELALLLGTIEAVILCTLLSILIAINKRIIGSYKTIIIILATGFLAMFLGALSGLVPVAYLTTVRKNM